MGKKKEGSLSNNWYLYREAWSLDKRRVLGEWGYSIFSYFAWAFYSLIFIKFILSSLEANRPANQTFLFVIISMVILGLMSLFQIRFSKYYRPLSGNRMFTAFSKKLFSKAAEADLASYENTEFYNSYTLAIKEASQRMESIITNIPGVGAAFLAAAAVSIGMGTIDPWVLVFIIFPVIGNFVFGKQLNKLNFKRDKEIEKQRRKISYVDRVFYMGEYAKEIRLSGISNVLNSIFTSGLGGIISTINRFGFKSARANFIQTMLCFVFNFEGLFLYGAYLAIVKKSISLSEFAVLASGVVSASWMVINMSNAVIELMKNGIYISNLRKFLDTEPSIKDNDSSINLPGPLESIEFRNVCFSYEGQKKKAIDNVSFRIKRGEKVALVGVNGAGKTSFVKMITRLYDPSAGSVLYNGEDIRNIKVNDYRNLFATAFQDFRIFSLSVAENVLMRPRAPEDTLAGIDDRRRIEQALDDAGVLEKIRSLPNGIDTVLTRELDDTGAALSGGEYQKIAIARAFIRDSEVYLLDEPSSALDPVAEYHLYENMMKVFKNKTVLFISHRLSSSTQADRIIVMDDGRIIEQGSHSDLMTANGKYARMFRMQAERYVVDNFRTFEDVS